MDPVFEPAKRGIRSVCPFDTVGDIRVSRAGHHAAPLTHEPAIASLVTELLEAELMVGLSTGPAPALRRVLEQG